MEKRSRWALWVPACLFSASAFAYAHGDIYPPTLAGSPGPGSVSLSWEMSELNDYGVDIQTTKVSRREGTNGAWEEVASLDGCMDWLDQRTEPHRSYFYRLESHLVDDSDPRRRLDLPPLKRVLTSNVVGPITPDPEVYIRLLQVQVPTREDRAAGRQLTRKAWLRVYRHRPYYGWRESRTQIVLPKGEDLEAPTPDRKKSDGKIGAVQRFGHESIDFSTPFVLLNIKIHDPPPGTPTGDTYQRGDVLAKVRDTRLSDRTFWVVAQRPEKGLQRVMKKLKENGSSSNDD